MTTPQVLKSNSVYRVADVILKRGIRWQKDRASISRSGDYTNTILYDYLLKMRVEKDWGTLKSVVLNHRTRYEKPSPDELVIHLRLGDIMEDSSEFVARNYTIYKDVYSRITIPQSLQGIKNATLVTALHFGANELNNRYFYSKLAHERSLEIILAIRRRLEQQGLFVKLKSSQNVDEDICYMVGSKYFVRSYSALAEIVEHVLDEDAQVFSPQDLATTPE